MVRSLLCCLFLYAYVTCYCQVNKTVTTLYTENNNLYERYEIRASDSVKNGVYQRFKVNGAKWVTGYYKNGQRDSLWTFFTYDSPRDTAKIKEVYDFGTGKEVFYRSSLFDSMPHPIGGWEELGYYICDVSWKLEPPSDSIIKYSGKKLSIRFKVLPSGKLSDISVSLPHNEVQSIYLQQLYTKALRLCPDWVPSKTPSIAMSSIFYELPLLLQKPVGR